ncbi:MAG: hypothetical protein AAGB23_01780 [Pseudomonadota bacterium]
MKLFARIIGMTFLVFGTLWALQGLGILMWPPQSFMLAQREWGLYGAVMAALGVVLLVISGRMGPRT